MSIVNGTDLMVFLGGYSIAYATNHSLSTSAETTTTSRKTKDNTGGAWQTSKVTNFSWSLSSENLYTTGVDHGNNFKQLFTIYKAGQPVDVKFCCKKESLINAPELGWTPGTSNVFSGKAIITSMELNAPDGEDASYTVEFTGDGELKYDETVTESSAEPTAEPTTDSTL